MTEFIKAVADAARNAESDCVFIAVDGRCGAGKTTFAERLSTELAATVLHMDDFFLPSEKRTPERIAEAGGNFDRERFLEEVLVPLHKAGKCTYRPYDCSVGDFADSVDTPESKVYVIEGSYSCHPELEGFYDLRLFLRVGSREQLQRLTMRENPVSLERFRERWIPMENQYFSAFDIENRAHIIL